MNTMTRILTALKTPLILLGISGGLALGTMALNARADLKSDNIPDRIPYTGTLKVDGQAFTGDVELVFRVYDGLATDVASWSETDKVHVDHGHFSVLLGQSGESKAAALRDVIEAADDLYVQVAMVDAASPDGLGEMVFPGRQRLIASPAGLVTKAFSNATVYTKLSLASSKTVNAAATDGALVVVDGDGNMLAADGNSIDASATLGLNKRSGKGVSITGSVDIQGKSLTVTDGGSNTHQALTRATNIVEINPDRSMNVVIDSDVVFNNDVSGLATTWRSQGATSYWNMSDLGDGSDYKTCPNNSVIYMARWVGDFSDGKAFTTVQCGRLSFDTN